MKKYIINVIALFLVNYLNSQTIQQIDSVSVRMCESLSGLRAVKDDVKVSMIFQKHLPDFFAKMNIGTQKEMDSVSDKVYYRLQRNCNQFRNVLDKLEENKSDWAPLNQTPTSKVSKKEFATFLKGGNFYYKEYDGRIVNVEIVKNTWTETFTDGSFSKLIIHPKQNAEFDLEFIESNNEMRKNLSVKGDLYSYGLYELNNGVFSVWVSQSQHAVYGFRIYTKK